MENKIAMKTSLQTSLTLSQQLIHALKLLEMSSIELHEYLYEEYLSNPVMELTYPEARRGTGFDPERIAVTPFEDIRLNLQLETGKLALGADERRISDFCFDAMDESGFLALTPQEIGQTLSEPAEKVESVLTKLKTVLPVGLFAKDIPAFFCAQLVEQGVTDQKLFRLLSDHFQDLLQSNAKQICDALAISSAQYQDYLSVMQTLQTRPIQAEPGSTPTRPPDVYAKKIESGWEVEILSDRIGNPSVQSEYEALYQKTTDASLHAYLKENLFRANQVIDSVEMRAKTLSVVTETILRHQEAHILQDEPLHYLKMADIADALELSVSTVSRAIRDKVVQIDRRVFFLQSLLSSQEYQAEGDATLSADHIKTKLIKWINEENRNKPLSDEAIRKRFAETGIALSRRVIAKYRESLQIPSSVDRKYLPKGHVFASRSNGSSH